MKLSPQFLTKVEPQELITFEEKKDILTKYLNNLVEEMLILDEPDWITDKLLIEIKTVKKYIKNIEHEAY